MKRLWSAARAALVVGLMTAGVAAFAQRTTVPLLDFKAVPVTAPTTKERVALAWQLAASRRAWTVETQPDSSLLVSTVRDQEFPVKLRVTFDAASYSVSYVDSKGLNHRPPPSPSEWLQSRVRYQTAASDQADRFKNSLDTPYAVQNGAYIHPFYEAWVRELLTEVRQQLKNAPPASMGVAATAAPASAATTTVAAPVIPVSEEAGVKLAVPGLSVASRARSATFKDAYSRQWSITRFDQAPPPADRKTAARDRAAEVVKSFRDEANRRRMQPSESVPLVFDEALPNAGVLIAVASQMRRSSGTGFDSHVDFRIVWPGQLPDAVVQGAVDWVGELQPVATDVLEVLRRIEPTR
jgi:hypothetical protein